MGNNTNKESDKSSNELSYELYNELYNRPESFIHVRDVRIKNYCSGCAKIGTYDELSLKEQFVTVCGKVSEKVEIIDIDYFTGWQYCTNNNECKDKVKNLILSYINDKICIPLHWFHFQNKILKCYGSRCNTVYDSVTKRRDPTIYYDKRIKALYVPVYINSCNQEYSVSLENIFRHNPEFYNALKSEENLFANDLKIGYNDLPSKIKELVEESYNNSIKFNDYDEYEIEYKKKWNL
jgi:hypothetical protein